MQRLNQIQRFLAQDLVLREATSSDPQPIAQLFETVYQGHYPLDFGKDPQILAAEIADAEHYLWLVAEQPKTSAVVGAVMFTFDHGNRLGKASGAVVSPEYRKAGIGSSLLRIGVEYLAKTERFVDVIYGTTRTVSQGPSKMVEEVGFHKLGLFPNAVQVDNPEHLNLDVYLTPSALESRRKKPYLFSRFYEVYNIARRQLGLERAYVVTERAPLKLSRQRIPFQPVSDQHEVLSRFRQYAAQNRLSNSFFPFHQPNLVLCAPDGGTEVFVWSGGVGRQASILGYRTDRVDTHDVLDSVAHAMQAGGAAYVELLVDAYDYMLQQEAYTARYIPSAYFPAMRLANDGLRDDYFVLSRTFRLLDFNDAFVTEENFQFLQAYLRCYNELYIQPLLSPSRQHASLA